MVIVMPRRARFIDCDQFAAPIALSPLFGARSAKRPRPLILRPTLATLINPKLAVQRHRKVVCCLTITSTTNRPALITGLAHHRAVIGVVRWLLRFCHTKCWC